MRWVMGLCAVLCCSVLWAEGKDGYNAQRLSSPPPRWMHVLCARLLPASAYHHDNKLVCTQSYVTCIPLLLPSNSAPSAHL